jgi:hypothetical protein
LVISYDRDPFDGTPVAHARMESLILRPPMTHVRAYGGFVGWFFERAECEVFRDDPRAGYSERRRADHGESGLVAMPRGREYTW